MRATNADRAVAHVDDLFVRRGAVVHQQRDVDRFGGARHAQHLTAVPVLADHERLGPEAFDRLAVLVEGAHEQRPLASLGQQRRGRRPTPSQPHRTANGRAISFRNGMPMCGDFSGCSCGGQYRPLFRRPSRRFGGGKSLKTNRLGSGPGHACEPGEVFHKVAVYWRAQRGSAGGTVGQAPKQRGFSIARATPGAPGECCAFGPGRRGQLHADWRDFAAGRPGLLPGRAPGHRTVAGGDGVAPRHRGWLLRTDQDDMAPLTPAAWMVAAGLTGWAALGALGGAAVSPEAAFGMAAPLVAVRVQLAGDG